MGGPEEHWQVGEAKKMAPVTHQMVPDGTPLGGVQVLNNGGKRVPVTWHMVPQWVSCGGGGVGGSASNLFHRAQVIQLPAITWFATKGKVIGGGG